MYEGLTCLFQVGLKDVTTNLATKRTVSPVTDTLLFFSLACLFGLYEEPFFFLVLFWTAIFRHLLFSNRLEEKWSVCKPRVETGCYLAGCICLATAAVVLLLCGLLKRSLCYWYHLNLCNLRVYQALIYSGVEPANSLALTWVIATCVFVCKYVTLRSAQTGNTHSMNEANSHVFSETRKTTTYTHCRKGSLLFIVSLTKWRS